jgi:N-acetylglucosamine kinase-like BadF-type ATPase
MTIIDGTGSAYVAPDGRRSALPGDLGGSR